MIAAIDDQEYADAYSSLWYTMKLLCDRLNAQIDGITKENPDADDDFWAGYVKTLVDKELDEAKQEGKTVEFVSRDEL